MGSLEDLDKVFAALEKQFPEDRRELVEDVGVIMYERVMRNIDAETKEQSGRLREACHLVIGSGGGMPLCEMITGKHRTRSSLNLDTG